MTFTGTVERVYRKKFPRNAGSYANARNQKSTVEIRTADGLLVEFAAYGEVLFSALDRWGRGSMTANADACRVGDIITVEGRVYRNEQRWTQLRDARIIKTGEDN